MEVHCEIKPGDVASEITIDDGMFEQANSLLLRAAGNAHEEAQHLGNGTERVHVIVIKAEAEVDIGQARIESLGAKEMFARAHSKACSTAIFAAQSIEARCRGIDHACIKVHFRGFTALELRRSK